MNIIIRRVPGHGWRAILTDRWGNFDGLFIGTTRLHLINEVRDHA